MPEPETAIKPRIASYLRTTWYTRWIIIAVVAASFWWLPGVKTDVVIALLPLAAFYNLFLIIGDNMNLPLASSRILMLLIDGFFALLLTITSGGFNSPYLVILSFMVISSAYWYGALSAIVVGLIEAGLLVANALVKHRPVPLSFSVQIAIFISLGVYVAWLSRSERTERNKLKDLGTEAEKERQQLVALVDNMKDAVLVVDNKGIVIMHNKAAAALTKTDTLSFNNPLDDMLSFVDKDNQPTSLSVNNVTEPLERKDLRLKAPDGSVMNTLISIAPYIVDRQNRGYVLMIKDVTKEKTIDQEREDFIAVASHELRTPLAIAQDELSFLMMPDFMPKDPEAISMLNGAVRSLKQLSHIINDLTNLSEVNQEKLPVDMEPLNPAELLAEFLSDYTEQAKKKGLDLRLDIDPGLDLAPILTSRYVIKEILTILITNALKFTEKGSVVLGISQSKNHPGGVTFSVKDSGIGISQSDQKRVFEKFFQSEEYKTRVQGGTGLGLYIAKRLAARLTADIWFESELGKGSTFYLWVPPYSTNQQDQAKVAKAETEDYFGNL